MRYLFLPGFLLSALLGCNSGSKKTETTAQSTDSTAVASADTVCYRQVVGRDSTRLRLVINGSTVAGELAVLPFEKDRAQGPISGTLTDNQIRADWQRSGEGVSQVYEVTFTLAGDAVSWREGERVEKAGRWVLKEPEKAYEYKLFKAECE
ncbi:hypothetical protein ACO2Q8_20050 [Larkinella sp. VNQ87]|uniref:hypothetical protein n=1 Tax=Larkinella sp. VNQ87 TaxID=3400921 RepID=UPI003C026278